MCLSFFLFLPKESIFSRTAWPVLTTRFSKLNDSCIPRFLADLYYLCAKLFMKVMDSLQEQNSVRAVTLYNGAVMPLLGRTIVSWILSTRRCRNFLISHYLVITSELETIYRVGQKTGLFFRLDNFVTVSPRKACSMSKFSQFYREKRYKTGISMSLNILCQICSNRHDSWNYAICGQNTWILLNLH